ncbi:MAG: T9SS type A sorting domain-containing protein [candidate division KSB1 bacterium]|nr:T9SS type A sorting domain-containing protein [candidate division KSB1 bacterium]MDZ7368448.1 T9SS type A sorting domain-containing protein [candidate division KSB1 bacterium]MDZ7406174.1 T9SS type A sorting domain-containing protein [candidate division KSB1 bacterium]
MGEFHKYDGKGYLNNQILAGHLIYHGRVKGFMKTRREHRLSCPRYACGLESPHSRRPSKGDLTMKSITRLVRFSQTSKSLFIILLAALNQTASAQNNGYWESIGFSSRWRDGLGAIAAHDSNIFLGTPLARWNGKTFVPFDGGPIYGLASEIVIVANALYVGGSFTTVGSIPAKNIAKWNLVTKSWSALGSHDDNGVNGRVQALAAYGRNLYVAYELTEGGILVSNIAKWNVVTNRWASVGKSINGKIYAIAASETELYAGGVFASAGGVPANNIAKWDGKEWCALGSGVNLEDKPFSGIPHVNAIAIFGQDVYIGGYFTKAGDVNANHIAKWNIIDKSWSALSSGTKNGVYYYSGRGNVYALSANDRALYVGGTFNMAGDQSANNIAKWDAANNIWSPLGSGLRGQVFAIATQGKKVYVGGGFTFAGGERSDRFAIWHEPNEPPILASLPELRFNEDKTLFYPIRHWYPFVTDADDADSTLKFIVLSGKQVKATRHPRGYSFSAPLNWFGRDTLQVIVTDPGQLADTTSLMITVDPVNDRPRWTGLPDSLSFKKGASAKLKMWDLVEDVETPDSLLFYRFSTSKSGLRWNFHRATGTLVLTAPQFHGTAHLFVKAGNGKAAAYDTIAVRVEMPNDILAAIEEQNSKEQIPSDFVLQQNYPNPFNPTTQIRYELPRAVHVSVIIYNSLGREIRRLVDRVQPAGYHHVTWNGRDQRGKPVPSGIYHYRLQVGDEVVATRKMLMAK